MYKNIIILFKHNSCDNDFGTYCKRICIGGRQSTASRLKINNLKYLKKNLAFLSIQIIY